MPQSTQVRKGQRKKQRKHTSAAAPPAHESSVHMEVEDGGEGRAGGGMVPESPSHPPSEPLPLPIPVDALTELPLPIPVDPLQRTILPDEPERAAEVLHSYAAGLYTRSGRLAATLPHAEKTALHLERAAAGVQNSGSTMTPPPPTLVRTAQAVGSALAQSAEGPLEVPDGMLEDVQMYDRNASRASLAIEKHLYKLASSKLVVRMDDAAQDELRANEAESQKLHDGILTPHYRHYLETVRDCVPHQLGGDADVYENSNGHLPQIEEVPRRWFHDYYRPPLAKLHERACAAGHQCRSVSTARIWKTRHPDHAATEAPPEVPLREFFLNREVDEMRDRVQRGESAEDVLASYAPRLCIMCLRAATNDASDEIASDVDRLVHSKGTTGAAHMNPVRIVQNHSYIMDFEGEYSSQACLMLCGQNFHGIIKPFIQFNSRFYTPAAHAVLVPETGERVRIRGWIDDPSVVYHHTTDGYTGVLEERNEAGRVRTSGIVRPISTPELLRKALSHVTELPPVAAGAHGIDMQAAGRLPADAQVTEEIAAALAARWARKSTAKREHQAAITATRAMLLTSQLTLLPVQHRALEPVTALGAGGEGGGAVWQLLVGDKLVSITTRHWDLRGLSAASTRTCRYYHAVACRINYLFTLQDTLQLYAVDDEGRRLRKRKRNVVRDRSVARLQLGMVGEQYRRLKSAYRGTFTNLDIVEELQVGTGSTPTPAPAASSATGGSTATPNPQTSTTGAGTRSGGTGAAEGTQAGMEAGTGAGDAMPPSSEDDSDSDDEAIMALQAALLREDSTTASVTEEYSDMDDHLLDGDDDIDIEAIMQQLHGGTLGETGAAGGDEGEGEGDESEGRAGADGDEGENAEGAGNKPRRTQTYRDAQAARAALQGPGGAARRRRIQQRNNTFGHLIENKKKQIRRRHSYNPKARVKVTRRDRRDPLAKSGTAAAAHTDADVHAIRKRRMYTREGHINKLIKRFLAAYVPIVKYMHTLAVRNRGELTDTLLEADPCFMRLWQRTEVPYEYHPGDALYMQWYTTSVPATTDPFTRVRAAGYMLPYPAGIDAVYACALERERPGTTRTTQARAQFAAFYAEVLAHEWHEGLGQTLWYPTLLAAGRGHTADGDPPPLAGHAVFWVTYYNVYQLELAARGCPPGVHRERSTVPVDPVACETAVPPHLRQAAQHVLTAHLPLACHLRHEWARQFATPGYRARVSDSEVPLDVLEPAAAHLVPDAGSPEILSYEKHLQYIDFWYQRTSESDIITQIISKCLPYSAHGRSNTNLGRQTLKKKPVYHTFLLHMARLVFYGLYDQERWDAGFIREATARQREEEAKATKTAVRPPSPSRARRGQAPGSSGAPSVTEILEPHRDRPYCESHVEAARNGAAARVLKKRRTAHYATRSYRPPLAAMCRLEEELFATKEALGKFLLVKSSYMYSMCVCILLTLLIDHVPSLQRLLAPVWSVMEPTFMRVGHMVRLFVGSAASGFPSQRACRQLEEDVHALRKNHVPLMPFPKGNFVEVLDARLNEIKMLFYAYTYHDVEALQCLHALRHHLAHHYATPPGGRTTPAAWLAGITAEGRTVATERVPGALLADAGKPFSIPPAVHLREEEVGHILCVLGADHVIHMVFQLAQPGLGHRAGAPGAPEAGLLPAIEGLFDGPRDVTHYATAFIDELYGPLQHSDARNRTGTQPIRTSRQRAAGTAVCTAGVSAVDAMDVTGARTSTSTTQRAKKRGPIPRNHMVGKKVPVNAVRHMHLAARRINYAYVRNRTRMCALLAPLEAILLRAGIRLPSASAGTNAPPAPGGDRLVRLFEEREEAGDAWLPLTVARQLLLQVPVDLLWDASSLYQRYKQAHLRVLQQRPSAELQRSLWARYRSVRSSEEADALVREVIPRCDLQLFEQLVQLYEERASAALLESKVAEMQGRTVFLLELLVRMRRQLYQVCTVPLNREDATAMQHAMQHKRYNVLPLDDGTLEKLPDSVYEVYATPCCDRVATISSPKSFGHFKIKYDSERDRYTCDMYREQRRKRNQANKRPDPPFLDLESDLEGGWVETQPGEWQPVLPAEANRGGQWIPSWCAPPQPSLAQMAAELGPAGSSGGSSSAAMSMFHSLDVNSQRQLCRRGKHEAEDASCEKLPPLYRVNLKGARLYYGHSATKRQAFQFCRRCGNFDAFTDANWTYNGYACRACRQRMVPAILPAKCDYCGQRVKGTERVVPMVNLASAEQPISLQHLCVQHQRFHMAPYTTRRRWDEHMKSRTAWLRYINGMQTRRESQIIQRTNARRRQNQNRSRKH